MFDPLGKKLRKTLRWGGGGVASTPRCTSEGYLTYLWGPPPPCKQAPTDVTLPPG